MKLEMVTIIACEVDTEVFTSDKMQVRSFLQKIPQVTFELMPWLHAAPHKHMHACVMLNAGILSMGAARPRRRTSRDARNAKVKLQIRRRCDRNEASLINPPTPKVQQAEVRCILSGS